MIRPLNVDDAPVLLIPMNTFLEQVNADSTCDSANSASEARERPAASSDDSIVSDDGMPGRDGDVPKPVARADPVAALKGDGVRAARSDVPG
jgi:CheY-like chemotaxis protein